MYLRVESQSYRRPTDAAVSGSIETRVRRLFHVICSVHKYVDFFSLFRAPERSPRGATICI